MSVCLAGDWRLHGDFGFSSVLSKATQEEGSVKFLAPRAELLSQRSRVGRYASEEVVRPVRLSEHPLSSSASWK